MANLVNVRRDALTETFTYDDGTEEQVDRIAYTVGDEVHTEDCIVSTRIEAGSGPEGVEEVKLADALEKVSNGSLTECSNCVQLRAGTHQPNSATSTEAMNDTKENTEVPTKTLTKIKLPDSLKPTATITAVVRVLEEGAADTYTTGDLAQAAEVTNPAANSAMLSLESAGIVTHTDTGSGRNKVRTWALKTATSRPAKKTAADYKKVMDAKPKPEPKAPPKAKAATAPKAASTKVAEAKVARDAAKQATADEVMAWMEKNPNVAFSVNDVEVGTGNGPDSGRVKTLRPTLWALTGLGKLVGPDTGLKTEKGHKGFMFVPPKGK
jgi:hypothetical protein